MRSIDPCPRCAGTKPHKGRKPDCGFVETEPPKGAKRIQSCYMKFGLAFIFFQNNLLN